MANLWQNWSGSVEFSPEKVVYPASEEEIIRLVKECRAQGKQLRVVGSGHSFTPLVKTNGLLVSLDNYQGVLEVDRATNQATVRAGTKIKRLGAELFSYGLAQPNLGDIDVQSIAGAVSTGTHGTGATLGSLSTQIVGLRLITAAGEIVECSATKNPELFKAGQVSLGALGIISQITLQLAPVYRLHYEWRKETLEHCLTNYEKYRQEFRHFEFYWFPHTNDALVKFMQPTEQPARSRNLVRKLNDTVVENGAFWLLSEVARLFPQRAASVAQLTGKLLSGGSDLNYSHQMFATTRLVKFQEMEYNIPVEHFADVIREIDQTIRREKFEVHFPLECRFVQADDIYLSPASQRASAYIAVHMYKGMQYKAYFAAIEQIFRRYQGRPHWGKLHTLQANELRQLYPDWEKFQLARQQLDPQDLFLNDYLKTLLVQNVTASV